MNRVQTSLMTATFLGRADARDQAEMSLAVVDELAGLAGGTKQRSSDPAARPATVGTRIGRGVRRDAAA